MKLALVLAFAFLAALTACGSDLITGVDLTDPSQLVGSYRLAVYQAGGETNPGGSLVLRADSTFTLSVNASTPWRAVSSGRWSWTGPGNVQLKPLTDFPKPWAFDFYGSIVGGGLGFGATGYPMLFFRKN